MLLREGTAVPYELDLHGVQAHYCPEGPIFAISREGEDSSTAIMKVPQQRICLFEK